MAAPPRTTDISCDPFASKDNSRDDHLALLSPNCIEDRRFDIVYCSCHKLTSVGVSHVDLQLAFLEDDAVRNTPWTSTTWVEAQSQGFERPNQTLGGIEGRFDSAHISIGIDLD